ncbi:hypothetical protein [Pseudoroseicyclus tamaricis]|uniref:Uncharacterized protein n=1 Tax=Pseudoroseicyclus tamaricis TaxID=2705421 RepID=A0A6B2JQJ4_9RHOB|nr:hypothetical protein [Pseudoroseicyclus tamaricis]NDV00957.1 hypothetical protein [Pseudoroseicyclus tamaricis]
MEYDIKRRIEELVGLDTPDVQDLAELHGLLSATISDRSSLLLRTCSEVFEEIPTTAPERRYALARIRGLYLAKAGMDEVPKRDVRVDFNTEEIALFEVDGDHHERALELCAQIRAIVNENPQYDENKKVRLLRKVSAIETEFLRSKGILQVVLGAASEIGDSVNKFGKDLKPITDRLVELKGIAKSGTREVDLIEGPEEKKKLPPPDDETK